MNKCGRLPIKLYSQKQVMGQVTLGGPVDLWLVWLVICHPLDYNRNPVKYLSYTQFIFH